MDRTKTRLEELLAGEEANDLLTFLVCPTGPKRPLGPCPTAISFIPLKFGLAVDTKLDNSAYRSEDWIS